MEEFFPSEVARLVLGYLSATKCQKSWKTFMEESSCLSEYFDLFQKGKVYPTNVNGKSLLDILHEYCCLKRETTVKSQIELLRNEESITEIEKNISVSKETMEKVVKKAVDYALHQFLPSVNSSKLKGSVLKDTADTSDDIPTDTIGKNELVNENAKKLHNESTIAANNYEKDILLNAPDENISSISPQITGVTSLNYIDSLKAYSNSKDDSFIPFNTECAPLVDFIKIEEEEDDVLVTDVVSGPPNKSGDIANGIIQCQNSQSVERCTVQTRESSKNSSNVSNFAQENADLSIRPVSRIDLGYLADTKNNSNTSHSDHNIENNKMPVDKSLNIASSSASLYDNNLGVQQISSLNGQSLVPRDKAINALTSSNNQSTFLISSTSMNNQCSTPVTYILPNYPCNNYIVKNNSPYHFVINNPNGLPLTVPTSNVSNPIITTNNSNNNSETSVKSKIPLDAGNKVLSTPSVVTNSKNSTTVIVKEKETAKRSMEEYLSARKKVNSCVESSKASTQAATKEKQKQSKKLDKLKIFGKETEISKPKRSYGRRLPKKINCLFPPPAKEIQRSPKKGNKPKAKRARVVLTQLSFESDKQVL